MKIKVDHVTNSSSEVFGVVLADSAVTAGLLLMLDSVTNAYRSMRPDQRQEALYDEMMMESEKVASRITDGILEDARVQEKIVKDAYSEALSTLNNASSALSSEMAHVKKNWENSSKTADITSNEYSLLQRKNDDYLTYLTQQLKQVDFQKTCLEKDRQEKTNLINERDAWIQQNQADLVTLIEQKSLMDGLNAAYYKATGEPGLWLKIEETFDARKAELEEALKSANATLTYPQSSLRVIQLSEETSGLMRQFSMEKKAFDFELLNTESSNQKKLIEDYENTISKLKNDLLTSTRFELAKSASQTLKYGSEIALEGLSDLGGTPFKIAFASIKAVATGIKDAKKDPKNRSKHLAKALLTVSSTALKDQLTEIPWAKDATTVLNTVLQSSLSASIAGESTASAIGSSLTKGIFDLGAEKSIAVLKESTTVEKQTLESEFDALSVEQILTDNPLNQKLNDSLKTELLIV